MLVVVALPVLATWDIRCAIERGIVQPNIGGDWREIPKVTGLTSSRKVRHGVQKVDEVRMLWKRPHVIE